MHNVDSCGLDYLHRVIKLIFQNFLIKIYKTTCSLFLFSFLISHVQLTVMASQDKPFCRAPLKLVPMKCARSLPFEYNELYDNSNFALDLDLGLENLICTHLI